MEEVEEEGEAGESRNQGERWKKQGKGGRSRGEELGEVEVTGEKAGKEMNGQEKLI